MHSTKTLTNSSELAGAVLACQVTLTERVASLSPTHQVPARNSECSLIIDESVFLTSTLIQLSISFSDFEAFMVRGGCALDYV